MWEIFNDLESELGDDEHCVGQHPQHEDRPRGHAWGSLLAMIITICSGNHVCFARTCIGSNLREMIPVSMLMWYRQLQYRRKSAISTYWALQSICFQFGDWNRCMHRWAVEKGTCIRSPVCRRETRNCCFMQIWEFGAHDQSIVTRACVTGVFGFLNSVCWLRVRSGLDLEHPILGWLGVYKTTADDPDCVMD